MAEKLVRDLEPYLAMRRGEPAPKMRVLTDGVEQFSFLLSTLTDKVAEFREAVSNPTLMAHPSGAGPSSLTAVEYAAAADAAAEAAAEILALLIAVVDPALMKIHFTKQIESRGRYDELVVIEVADDPK